MFKIYKVTCLNTGKYYFGRTHLSKERKLNEELWNYSKYTKGQRSYTGWINIIEGGNFDYKVLVSDIETKPEASELEAFYVNNNINNPLCTNMRYVYGNGYTRNSKWFCKFCNKHLTNKSRHLKSNIHLTKSKEYLNEMD